MSRPFSLQLDGKLEVGTNVEIGRNVSFRGNVSLGKNVVVEEGCILDSCSISDSVHVKSRSIIQDSEVKEESFVGPFARLRSNAYVGKNCQIGNFVEIKSSKIGNGCRINHMAFIGDAELGKNVTIGAGVITCNHDGLKTQKTEIGDEAYIGSNSNLIAPIKIGSKVTVGSGSTINEDVEDNRLAIARSKQMIIPDWDKKS